MDNLKIKIPVWFWIVAIISLLWNLMGVYSFYAHTFISEAALAELSEAERAHYGEYPSWTSIVFAIAVFGGLIGSLGLVLKKKWSKIAFIVSLCAVIPQMVHSLFFTSSIEVYGAGQAAAMPAFIVVFGFFLVWFSSYAIKKDWLD